MNIINRNRLFGIIGLLAVILTFRAAYADQTEQPEVFTFLTWSEYINPELVAEFEQQYNAKINFVYFETDDARDRMMVETQGGGFDLILVSKLMLDNYRQRGWLEALDYNQIPNLKHLYPRFLDGGSEPQYQAPYFWGTIGIAYRKDLVQEKITRLQQLFYPGENLRGKILMINTSRELVGLALKALGYSGNSEDLQQLDQAWALLQLQKPYVKDYSYLTIMEQSPLVTGDIAVAMIYSGDALFLKEHNADINFVLPEEGSFYWTDVLVIGKGSTKKQLVMKFIDFINEPKNAARNAEYVYYATPNKSAEQFLAAEFLNDPVIYPNVEDKQRLEVLSSISVEAQRRINRIMLNLTRP